VKSSELSVLQVVLESDIERTQLMNRYQELLAKQDAMDESEMANNIDLLEELTVLQDRMDQIGAETAEVYSRDVNNAVYCCNIIVSFLQSRAASILSGLQFTEEMQAASTSSLSGGWLMRVSLACALYIEPDVLMLDEPTNHLDLEAVIWLQTYLLQYPHTVILVSHDRAFLNGPYDIHVAIF
jgi:ATP-binding cassette subfamily F protein 3